MSLEVCVHLPRIWITGANEPPRCRHPIAPPHAIFPEYPRHIIILHPSLPLKTSPYQIYLRLISKQASHIRSNQCLISKQASHIRFTCVSQSEWQRGVPEYSPHSSILTLKTIHRNTLHSNEIHLLFSFSYFSVLFEFI